jgi:prophage regulatory protein
MHQLPETGYLRLSQIIGQRVVTEEEAAQNRHDAEAARSSGKEPNTKPKRARRAIPAIVPVGKSHWWAGVASGKYPKPYRGLGLRTTVWRVEDIRGLINQGTGEAGSK